MTKNAIRDTVKQVLADRGLFGLMIGVGAAALIYIAYVMISIESRDIQVVTQYSAFGESHFYKSRWFYLYSFVALGVLVAGINATLMAKLLRYERRAIAMALGWLTIVFFVVATMIAHAVLQLAFL